jgi:hypothetical protein
MIGWTCRVCGWNNAIDKMICQAPGNACGMPRVPLEPVLWRVDFIPPTCVQLVYCCLVCHVEIKGSPREGAFLGTAFLTPDPVPPCPMCLRITQRPPLGAFRDGLDRLRTLREAGAERDAESPIMEMLDVLWPELSSEEQDLTRTWSWRAWPTQQAPR